ncbi:type II toxin-antitoxin system RelE/ParE family toxin [Peteryoungia ipomoeae]|uniref:Toxin n=1 Tax=Peteryoungia ipomoeae TaxID=1210932 RepID=A0A4S8NV61_9HYPH|nr:type II toxin-antitoxin system RelE/ParE family toxin [Peteryoungia ipomoeae]THV21298.1 type II toxin-antitoxin system RelE/ParE family toxin [Peteryoungia ipomoeae]
MRYRLSRKAEADIIDIAETGIRNWGLRQARTYHDGLFELFELIASTPEMARERDELIPPMRVQRFRAHLIVYRIEDNEVLIVRIRHSREDWQSASR